MIPRESAASWQLSDRFVPRRLDEVFYDVRQMPELVPNLDRDLGILMVRLVVVGHAAAATLVDYAAATAAAAAAATAALRIYLEIHEFAVEFCRDLRRWKSR